MEERVSFINEEDLAQTAVKQLLGFNGCLADVTGDEVLTGDDFNEGGVIGTRFAGFWGCIGRTKIAFTGTFMGEKPDDKDSKSEENTGDKIPTKGTVESLTGGINYRGDGGTI